MREEMWNSYIEREANLWTWERELLATTVELLHGLIRQNQAIWGGKKGHTMAPLKIPRPNQRDAEAAKPTVTNPQLIAMLTSES